MSTVINCITIEEISADFYCDECGHQWSVQLMGTTPEEIMADIPECPRCGGEGLEQDTQEG